MRFRVTKSKEVFTFYLEVIRSTLQRLLCDVYETRIHLLMPRFAAYEALC